MIFKSFRTTYSKFLKNFKQILITQLQKITFFKLFLCIFKSCKTILENISSFKAFLEKKSSLKFLKCINIQRKRKTFKLKSIYCIHL